MKKQNFCYGILLIFTLNACVLEHGDLSAIQSYNAGKQAFNYVEGNMADMLAKFDIALRLNAYLATPEEERAQAEDRYFPEYKIRANGENQWIGLYNGDTVFRISTGEYVLNQEGTLWKYDDRYTEETNITCLQAGKWLLETRDTQNYNWVSNARFEIETEHAACPENFQNSDFIVSGSGQSVSYGDKEIILDFVIVEPMQKMASSKFLFSEGYLTIKATDTSLQLTEYISARLTQLSDRQRSLKIVYKGETYSYSETERD